ncbi:MAG: PQQ-binding-like beta-propeller repeat protein [Armatimonadetes bacterium]|nr:PQQ-binding-like beta-propeller repeat protein [Armatimonadota bacterium]
MPRLWKNALLTLGTLLASTSLTQAQDWANWRGPNYNGSINAANLPVKFSTTEGVKWSAELPGPSAGTPVVWKNYVFVTAADLKTQELLGLCFDRSTGTQLWKRSIGTGYLPDGQGNKVQIDERGNYASPSPVTDGKRVVFFFGNGDLAAFTVKGEKIWQRNLQKENGDFCFNWTFSSSPILYAGKLYLQILQRDQTVSNRGKNGSTSYLLALNPETGKELWRSERPTDAKMESREAYSTPIPYQHNGRKEILIAGGDYLTGHDPENGKELWRWGTWNPNHNEVWWRLVPSPVAGAGVVLACAPKRAPVYAAKLGGTGQAPLAWQSEAKGDTTSDVPTPLFYEGKFYVLSDVKKALTCVDPATGNPIWTTKVPGIPMCWGSPTGADGKIYAMSLRGEVFVFSAQNGSLLAQNAMAGEENELRSTIAVAYNNLFIRTNTRLYCVGK